MKKFLITGAALAALAVASIGAVHVTSQDSRTVCLPPAVVQAWS
jgi:hypothetical protein